MKALETSKADWVYLHANYCSMSIVFHENKTVLKMEGKKAEEPYKTIDLSYLL